MRQFEAKRSWCLASVHWRGRSVPRHPLSLTLSPKGGEGIEGRDTSYSVARREGGRGDRKATLLTPSPGVKGGRGDRRATLLTPSPRVRGEGGGEGRILCKECANGSPLSLHDQFQTGTFPNRISSPSDFREARGYASIYAPDSGRGGVMERQKQ